MDGSGYQQKESLFEEVSASLKDKELGSKRHFKCLLCSRILSSKQRVLTHLHSAHHRSPLKRVKKIYVKDPSVPIPSRTLRFWRANLGSTPVELQEEQDGKPAQDMCIPVSEVPVSPLPSENSCESAVPFPDSPEYPEIMQDEGASLLKTSSEEACFSGTTSVHEYSVDSGSELSDSEVSVLESDLESDSEFSYSSMSDSVDSESVSSESFSDEETTKKQSNKFTETQLHSLSILAFILRHNLTGVAANDLLSLQKVMCPNSSNLGNFKYEELLQTIDKVHFKVSHYCPCCQSVFPENREVYRCETPNCTGLRYRGGLSAQSKSNCQPHNFFVIADVRSQLKYLLEQDGVLKNVFEMKAKARFATESKISSLSDITDGKYYRSLLKEGEFLADANCISGVFNTDGIPLFKSSRVKLWPIFIAINEFPLSQRFSRENMVLVGIWQGKANPPFLQYMNAFGEEMCNLYDEGIIVNTSTGDEDESVTIKFGVMLGVLDLQAKAYVLNMTMHNGESGCCTCEEPGKSVKQGKGHARCYPYRSRGNRYPFRSSDNIKYQTGPQATRQNRIKGICGITGLTSMPWFDVILGIVPDYMHGVLMGVTKTLMFQWFSPTHCKEPFFVGNHLSSISKRMMHVNPPDYIERLPRDLEKHYAHLKATELQAWLLYYALPCLTGYLPASYLEHFACLSEGIHLLLGESISEDDLQRAEKLLDTFYQTFSNLYGEGNCGLNVHNIGAHLVFYVRLWGPLFAWSCFGFEDWNAAILQSVHGTGDVTRQIVYHTRAQLQLKSLHEKMPLCAAKHYMSKLMKQSKQWKVVTIAQDCAIAGSVVKLTDVPANQVQLILDATGLGEISQLKKVLRVQHGKEKLYSSEYKRMKKRICYVALTRGGQIVSIKYFIFNERSKAVFALTQIYDLRNECFLFDEVGWHVLRVVKTDQIAVIPVGDIQEKLFFASVARCQDFVIRMPNMHGHGLLK